MLASGCPINSLGTHLDPPGMVPIAGTSRLQKIVGPNHYVYDLLVTGWYASQNKKCVCVCVFFALAKHVNFSVPDFRLSGMP